jgi:anti-anti-sigma factor
MDDVLPSIGIELRPANANGYTAVVSLFGEHDAATAGEVGDTLAALDGDVLVNLAECTFIDSSLIGVLLAGATNLRRDGHHLELLVPPANVTISRVLAIVRADTVLVVHPEWPDTTPE